jgi:hypothetical protein
MKKIAIILGILSFSGIRIECSFMRKVIPGALIAGASAYVGGRYYYNYLTKLALPKMIDETVNRICSPDENLTTYFSLAAHMQKMSVRLQTTNIGMNSFNAIIFRMFGGDESSLRKSIARQCKIRENEMIASISPAMLQDTVNSICSWQTPYTKYTALTAHMNGINLGILSLKEISTVGINKLNEKIFGMCKQRACDAIDAFFARRIETLKSFHEERDYPKIWRDLYDELDEKSLEYLQKILQEAFPEISATYINDRYQKHMREAYKHTLIQHPSRCTTEGRMLDEWFRGNAKLLFSAPHEQEHNVIDNNLKKTITELLYPPQLQKRARILVFSSPNSSCGAHDSQAFDTKSWYNQQQCMITVPVYHAPQTEKLDYLKTLHWYSRHGYDETNDKSYITVQDIAQCLKSLNPQQYKSLATLSDRQNEYHKTSSYWKQFHAKCKNAFEACWNSYRIDHSPIDCTECGDFPFYACHATIKLNKEGLPKSYTLKSGRTPKIITGGLHIYKGLIKLPIATKKNADNESKEWTYAINIYPFEVPSRQQ